MGDSRKDIREKILTRQVYIGPSDIPGFDPNCASLINSLITRNPEERLGHKGIHEIKNHPWFDEIDWKKLRKKQLKPLFTPGVPF